MEVSFSTHYWNYYKTLEDDLEKLSRYIEFSNDNMLTYSTELTRILLSSSSEVDVIMKDICQLLDPDSKRKNIDNYREVIKKHLPDIIKEEIIMPFHNLNFKPWDSWKEDENPIWWKNHNNVKHHRNEKFNEANLNNTLNSVGALLICNLYYYKLILNKIQDKKFDFKDVTRLFEPKFKFFRMNGDYYYANFIV